MIQNLSAPVGSSVNMQIDKSWTAVIYSTVQQAIELVHRVCPLAFMAKTDVKTAFRAIPLHPNVYHLFAFQWKRLFYVDFALPMSCSASCHLFEKVSSAVQWIAETKLGLNLVHYLDDFFWFLFQRKFVNFNLILF